MTDRPDFDEAIADAYRNLRKSLIVEQDRLITLLFGPWRTTPFPQIVLFPRLEQAASTVARWSTRAGQALGVLMHGMPEVDR